MGVIKNQDRDKDQDQGSGDSKQGKMQGSISQGPGGQAIDGIDHH